MIAAAAFWFALQTGNPVAEYVDPNSRFVSVQAVLKLPSLSGHEFAEAEVLAETMADEVEGYSKAEMRDIAGRAGDGLKITLMPDHLRIQIGVLPSDVKPAIGYIEQILRNSRLSADAINKAVAEIPYRTRPIWAVALEPLKFEFYRTRREDIVDLYHRICRPENVWLSVGGPIQPGDAADYWKSKIDGWDPGKAPKPSLDVAPLPGVANVAGREAVIELRGRAIIGKDPAIAARLLALIALGSGKGSAMFARLRDEHGWSYRQEAVLWPTPEGFLPRLIMLSGDQTPGTELAKAVKETLADAVKSWGNEDLARARGMADGILNRGFPMSPLYFNPSWPITSSLHDQTFMSAYWPMKTGRAWNPKKLMGEIALLNLDDLKEAAQAILADSIRLVIPARG